MEKELNHHGILGQRWGVRRYQNEDGTRTSAGKKRYAENYSEEQRDRDTLVYGKNGTRRINKRMLKGSDLANARSSEADRVAKYRKAANKTHAILGVMGGLAVVGTAVYAGRKVAKGEYSPAEAAIITGNSAMHSVLLSQIGSRAVMSIGGYGGHKTYVPDKRKRN